MMGKAANTIQDDPTAINDRQRMNKLIEKWANKVYGKPVEETWKTLVCAVRDCDEKKAAMKLANDPEVNIPYPDEDEDDD